jgi:hypothetical protein
MITPQSGWCCLSYYASSDLRVWRAARDSNPNRQSRCFGDYLEGVRHGSAAGGDAGVVQALLCAEADDEPWDVEGLGR